IATGIAILGALFESSIADKLKTALAGTAGAAPACQLGHAVAAGGAGAALQRVPAGQRAQIAGVVHGAFASAMNEILLVAAIVSFTGAVLGLVLVRGSDFVASRAPEPAAVAAG